MKRRRLLPLLAGALLLSASLKALSVGLAVAPVLAEPAQVNAEMNAQASLPAPSQLAEMVVRLQERAAELDQREAELEARAAALRVVEAQIAAQIAALEEAERRLSATIAQADRALEEDLVRLTAVFEAMKPEQAARVFSEMAPEFAAGLLGRLRPETAAAIMAGIEPRLAYAVSAILAGRNANVPRRGESPDGT